jgi:hypothetical protein
MIWVFNAHAPLFRSGWFVESLATQSLVIFAIGVLLPFSPLAHVLRFTALPAGRPPTPRPRTPDPPPRLALDHPHQSRTVRYPPTPGNGTRRLRDALTSRAKRGEWGVSRWECPRSDRPRRRPRKGAIVTPAAAANLSESSPVSAHALPAEERAAATLVPRDGALPSAWAPFPQRFELGCADVHPVRCNLALRSSNLEELVALVSAHGASAHGFTPVWYSPERVAAMATAATVSRAWRSS